MASTSHFIVSQQYNSCFRGLMTTRHLRHQGNHNFTALPNEYFQEFFNPWNSKRSLHFNSGYLHVNILRQHKKQSIQCDSKLEENSRSESNITFHVSCHHDIQDNISSSFLILRLLICYYRLISIFFAITNVLRFCINSVIFIYAELFTTRVLRSRAQ